MSSRVHAFLFTCCLGKLTTLFFRIVHVNESLNHLFMNVHDDQYTGFGVNHNNKSFAGVQSTIRSSTCHTNVLTARCHFLRILKKHDCRILLLQQPHWKTNISKVKKLDESGEERERRGERGERG